MRLPLLVALCLMVLPAVTARAGILRSESILPAGQSGFVAGGGGGSPHLYDQLPLYLDFQYKPADLGGSAGAAETPRAGVQIARDAYGVPSVTGATEDGLWWGAGYAVAQDRLAELELFRRRGTGTLAEILGKGSLQDDIIARRDYYTVAELRRMFMRLHAAVRARFEAYAAGVNGWIEHVRQTPSDLPLEFTALRIPLRPWTALDSLRIGVLLARTIPTGDGNELDNMAALRAFGPRLFQSILPLRVPGQITSIPRVDGTFPSQPGRTRRHERAAFARSQRFVRSLPAATANATPARVPTDADRPARAIDVGLGHLGGSFMWAVRRPEDNHTFLVNGPQLGYQAPSTFVELDLHGPRTDVRGGTAPGVPIIGPGHNAHVAWGFTSGLSDDNDVYAERLSAAGSRDYRFRGRTLRMSCRQERFRYRSGSTTRSMTESLCRTVHGPVQARAGRVAYARRYALWGREGETITGLAALNDARNLQEVDRALRQVSWNENIAAADDRGDIGFWHPGLHPLRPRGWDERLPYPGTGDAEWRGLLPRSRDPHVINPRGRNWVANWNNVPSADWTSGDAPARERLNGPFHRIAELQGLVRAAASAPTFESVGLGVIHANAVTATQRPTATAELHAAAQAASGPSADVLNTLLAWDGNYDRTAPDGTVEPGVATWRAFKAACQRVALGNPDRAERGLVGEPGSEGFVESTLGETFALRTLDAAGLRRAATLAAADLMARFGTSDPSQWREPRAMVSPTAQGLPSPPEIRLINRGSFEQIVELGP
ncbi:MAG TPA: penicillin acylase family protein [Solirubrobacteraceae bacterium]|nr:penicillin acylase family protein [Solirubrobacteraceae bacterium]